MNAPGLIRFLGLGPDAWQRITTVSSDATRGSVRVDLSDTSQLTVGSWITIGQSADPGNTLFEDLNRMPSSWTCPTCINPVSGNGETKGNMDVLRFHSKITGVDGSTVTLERPLPFNISLAWKPNVYSHTAGIIREVGISDLTIEMRHSPYVGHFLEPGFNGLEFTDASRCWAKDLTILNGDTLLSFHRSSFCTADGIATGTTSSRNKATGMDCHHGINVSNSQDILVSNVAHRMKCFHDMTVFNFTVAVAFVNITGPDLALDHHRFYPYGTLWANIDVGLGKRVFDGGGLTLWGSASSSFTTFWNVKGLNGITSVPKRYDFGRFANFIGMGWRDAWQVDGKSKEGWEVQNVPKAKSLVPLDLIGAMREIRIKARENKLK